jgi:hypothetical protein
MAFLCRVVRRFRRTDLYSRQNRYTGIESNLGTAIRTIVVLAMAWGIVFLQKKQYLIKN